jgi:hypothetical protein
VLSNGREALSIVAMLFGPDQRGLVARVAGLIYERDGNIFMPISIGMRRKASFFNGSNGGNQAIWPIFAGLLRRF